MTTFFWHRRDLRIHDNAGLYKALSSEKEVQPIFVFDTTILTHLKKDDQRVLFIYQEIEALKQAYNKLGSDLQVYYGNPLAIIPEFTNVWGYINEEGEFVSSPSPLEKGWG